MILDAAGATHDVKTAARIAAAPDYLQADIRAQQQASAQLGALMDAADAAIAEVAVPLSGTRRGPGGAASKKTAIKLSRLATRQAKAKRSAIVSPSLPVHAASYVAAVHCAWTPERARAAAVATATSSSERGAMTRWGWRDARLNTDTEVCCGTTAG